MTFEQLLTYEKHSFIHTFCHVEVNGVRPLKKGEEPYNSKTVRIYLDHTDEYMEEYDSMRAESAESAGDTLKSG
jgi:hypothetical protein